MDRQRSGRSRFSVTRGTGAVILVAAFSSTCSPAVPPTGTGGTGGTTGSPPVCGNGKVEGDEACDGSDLHGQTCAFFAQQIGQLKCDSSCQFDVSECRPYPGCGDGTIAANEQCEPPRGLTADSLPDLNGATCQSVVPGSTGGKLGCDWYTCHFDTSGCAGVTQTCGNGIIEGSEECDGEA